MAQEQDERLYDPRYYHPCQGCKWLAWDNSYLDHGEAIEVPYCKGDYHLAVARCPHYEGVIG